MEEFIHFIEKAFPKEQHQRIFSAFDFLQRSGSGLLGQYLEYNVFQKGRQRLELLSEFPFSESPDPEQKGLLIGNWCMNNDAVVRFDIKSLSGSILFTGATGSGKTNSLMWLLHQIRDVFHQDNIRFIVIASKYMCEQRSLLVNAPADSIYFLDKSNFALNPLNEFRNYNRNSVIPDTARCLATELGIYEAGQLYLQSNLIQFVEKFSDGNLVEFVDWLSQKKEKSRDYVGYKDRLLVRLIPIMNEIGDIFDYEIGLNDELITNNLVIELPCSSTFISSSVAALIMMRMYRIKSMNIEFQKYQNILVFEDIYDAIARSDSRG